MSETCPRGPVEPLVSLRPEYSRLIQLAARIARREGMPDEDSWRWPSRVPVELYRQAQKANALAHDTCGDWATELRQIADAIVAASGTRERIRTTGTGTHARMLPPAYQPVRPGSQLGN